MNEYREAKLLYIETKERQRALHNVVKEIQERDAPAHALLEYVLFYVYLSGIVFQHTHSILTSSVLLDLLH